MTEIAERKRALILEAELHRRAIVEESAVIAARAQSARALVERNRWLLGGAAAAASAVVRSRPRSLLGIVPTLVTAWRSFRARRADSGEASQPPA